MKKFLIFISIFLGSVGVLLGQEYSSTNKIKTEVCKDDLHQCIYDGYIRLVQGDDYFVCMSDIMSYGWPKKACLYSFWLISDKSVNLHDLAVRIWDKPYDGMIMIHLNNGSTLKIKCQLHNHAKDYTKTIGYSCVGVYIFPTLADIKTLCTSSIKSLEVNGYNLNFSEFKNSKDLFYRLTRSYESLLNVNLIN